MARFFMFAGQTKLRKTQRPIRDFTVAGDKQSAVIIIMFVLVYVHQDNPGLEVII